MSLYPGVAVVTGGGSGIGRKVAISFAREGCHRVAILDRDVDGLRETKDLIEGLKLETKVFGVKVDVEVEDEIINGMGQVVDHYGRIDYAVNCAGIYGPIMPSHELSTADFDKVMGINFRGVFLCSRTELRIMLKQDPLETHDGRLGNRGSIVHIASNLGINSKPSIPAYNAAKAAIISLTKTDALDYSEKNIRVNCVCPGLIE